jgi:hypothetical protein
MTQIKLGQGVVGKSTYAIAALFAVLGVVAIRVEPVFLFPLAILAVGAFVYFQRSIVTFADQNPGVAMLEGADLLQWQKTDLAAKGLPTITIEQRTPSLPPSRSGGPSEHED